MFVFSFDVGRSMFDVHLSKQPRMAINATFETPARNGSQREAGGFEPVNGYELCLN